MRGTTVRVADTSDEGIIMGASGWSYRTAYRGDIREAVESLEREVFAAGDYYWPYEFYDHLPSKARPGSVDELWQDELAQEEGTHSILDMETVIGAGDSDEHGTIRPLSAAEMREHFDTDRPTPEIFDRAEEAGTLPDLTPRWSAVCMPLHIGGAPAQIAFWGYSGD
ncbi:hypothetical protein ACWEV3_38910 [Saccharopolyspora sp. NPDC003752]